MLATRPPARSAADRVLRARVRETIHFPDLTERRALKLATIPHYVSRVHFGLWHRRMGQPNFAHSEGLFTPLYYVELETTDVTLDPMSRLRVHGETFLARSLDAAGATDHIVREGRYIIRTPAAAGDTTDVGSARLINVYTRYDPDPARRRVTELPADMGLGPGPARITDLPELEVLVPNDRHADFTELDLRVWHYGQTDPNRHVNGMEYLRLMEAYVAENLHRSGHDLRQVYFSGARIIYRKPCFRGEGYRRAAWFRSEAPLIIAGAFFKDGDTRPAVAVELTVSRHETE